MLGLDLEMSCAKFQGNRFKFDGEIEEKHVLQVIVSLCLVLTYARARRHHHSLPLLIFRHLDLEIALKTGMVRHKPFHHSFGRFAIALDGQPQHSRGRFTTSQK